MTTAKKPLLVRILERWLGDLDDFFAYETVKMICVLDRRIGMVYWFVITLVLIYFLFNLIAKKSYLDIEKSEGWSIIQVLDEQYSTNTGVAWDVFDRVTNPGEQGATFVPTRVLVTTGQTQEGQYCESPSHPCTADYECDIGNEVLQQARCSNGHCLRRQWCPAENEQAATTQTFYMDLDKVDIRFWSYVRYFRARVEISTAKEMEVIRYPEKRANTYPLHDLLRMANVNMEEVALNGAILNLNVIFKCQLDKDQCETEVKSINVDTKTGFNHVKNHEYYDNGVRKRDTWRMYGIRMNVFTLGLGERVAFSMIVLQISSCLAMLGAAAAAADFFMMTILPQKKNYTDQKVIQTEDFYEDDD